MSNALIQQNQFIEIAERVSRGEITTSDDLVKLYGCNQMQAIALLGNKNFISTVAKISKAKAMLAWHSKAMPKLFQLLDDKDPKIAMQAMKMVGQYTDSIKGSGLDININLEGLVKAMEESKPSNNLKNDDMSNVIDITEFRRVMNE